MSFIRRCFSFILISLLSSNGASLKFPLDKVIKPRGVAAKKKNQSNGRVALKTAVVMTSESHALFSASAGNRVYPASLTKLATLYILFQSLKNGRVTFNTKFKVSRNASAQAPSKLGLAPESAISVLDCIRAIAVKSANDVAVVVAEGIAGSVQNFCVLMNQLKDRIGMRNTNFKNPSGLFDVGQFTTAMDIAKLGMALYKDFPQYRPFLSMKTFRFGGAIYQTHCKILHWCDAVDGAKTGYIRQSGFNIYVTAHNPVNGLRIFIVVTGWDSQKSRDLYVSQLLHKWLKTASLGPGQNHAHKDSVTLQQRNESLYSQMIAPSNSQNDQRLTNPKSSQQPVQFVPVMPPAKKSTPHSNNDDVSRRDGADEVICQDDEVSVPAVKLPEDLDTLYADEAILAESEFEICN